MSRQTLLSLYFFGIFLQAGAYGLTFLLPALFANFGGNEADVGFVLALTAIATLAVVIYSGHITTLLGLMPTIALSGGLITLAALLKRNRPDRAGGRPTAGCGLGFIIYPDTGSAKSRHSPA